MGGPQASPGGGRPSISPGEAFNYGWLKFQQNIGPIIIASLVGWLILIVITVITVLLSRALFFPDTTAVETSFGTFETLEEGSFIKTMLGSVLIVAGYSLGQFILQMAIIRGSLKITYGEPIEVGQLFSTENLGQYLLASLVVTVATFIGFLLCFIPGFLVWFFAQFFGFFILDKKMGAMDAIMASFKLVNRNLGSLIGFYIGVVIATVIGAALCGIGLLVAIPVVIIATAYMYRGLQGEPVAT
jgi:uncharacterized membrane protein